MSRLLKHHEKVLRELDCQTREGGEWCTAFAPLAIATGMEARVVRRIVRHLARKGFAEYHKALITDEGYFAGAGYCITKAGREALGNHT